MRGGKWELGRGKWVEAGACELAVFELRLAGAGACGIGRVFRAEVKGIESGEMGRRKGMIGVTLFTV